MSTELGEVQEPEQRIVKPRLKGISMCLCTKPGCADRTVNTSAYLSLGLAFALISGCNTGNGGSVNGAVQKPVPKQAHSVQARASGNRTVSSPTVSPERTRSLTWRAPLTREDGSSLYPGEILGYRIYFKKNHHQRYRTLPLLEAHETRLSLERFPPGVYQFAISTIDTDGLESRRSVALRVDVI